MKVVGSVIPSRICRSCELWMLWSRDAEVSGEFSRYCSAWPKFRVYMYSLEAIKGTEWPHNGSRTNTFCNIKVCFECLRCGGISNLVTLLL